MYEIDLASFRLAREMSVFTNPNTIDLLDDRFLFVSSRGPNNPADYTLRSPRNGKITVIDIARWEKLCEIEGGNQPTGLAVSASGSILCFSDFQDGALELYEIRRNASE